MTRAIALSARIYEHPLPQRLTMNALDHTRLLAETDAARYMQFTPAEGWSFEGLPIDIDKTLPDGTIKIS